MKKDAEKEGGNRETGPGQAVFRKLTMNNYSIIIAQMF
jgi:hypothetical protein